MMKTGDDIRWIVGGYQAPNGNNKTKWEEVRRTIEDLDDEYKYPKILYIDVNTSIHDDKYKK